MSIYGRAQMFEKIKEGVVGALDKTNEIVRELNDTILIIKTLGISVKDISFAMGIPPEMKAKLIGSVDALDQDKIKKLIEDHQKNKTLTLILEALKTVSVLKDLLPDVQVRGIKIELQLGITPKVDVKLLTEKESSGDS
jgi:hypothetical protein